MITKYRLLTALTRSVNMIGIDQVSVLLRGGGALFCNKSILMLHRYDVASPERKWNEACQAACGFGIRHIWQVGQCTCQGMLFAPWGSTSPLLLLLLLGLMSSCIEDMHAGPPHSSLHLAVSQQLFKVFSNNLSSEIDSASSEASRSV